MAVKKRRKAVSKAEQYAELNGGMGEAGEAGLTAMDQWRRDRIAIGKVRNAVGCLKRKANPDPQYIAQFIQRVCDAVEK